ncbi:MAG: DUF1883 domain-containing protein [Flavobacteriales bacterium]|nr:DUF1883 domain-containing protein [Flavobacteriales bacterium]
MKFLYQSFEAKRKEIIEVEIDRSTKVRFMTGRNLKAYRQGRTFSYHGGLFEESPVRFVVPFDSVWTVVVEKGTYANPEEVHAQCKLLNPNNKVRSSIAVDAPPSVREHELAEAGEDIADHTAELGAASKSEG